MGSISSAVRLNPCDISAKPAQADLQYAQPLAALVMHRAQAFDDEPLFLQGLVDAGVDAGSCVNPLLTQQNLEAS